MPLHDTDIIFLERFLDHFSGMFWIVVLLELPIVAELEFLCRYLQVFIENLDVILRPHDFLDPDGVPCALAKEASP